jgi:hypothetical protein
MLNCFYLISLLILNNALAAKINRQKELSVNDLLTSLQGKMEENKYEEHQLRDFHRDKRDALCKVIEKTLMNEEDLLTYIHEDEENRIRNNLYDRVKDIIAPDCYDEFETIRETESIAHSIKPDDNSNPFCRDLDKVRINLTEKEAKTEKKTNGKRIDTSEDTSNDKTAVAIGINNEKSITEEDIAVREAKSTNELQKENVLSIETGFQTKNNLSEELLISKEQMPTNEQILKKNAESIDVESKKILAEENIIDDEIMPIADEITKERTDLTTIDETDENLSKQNITYDTLDDSSNMKADIDNNKYLLEESLPIVNNDVSTPERDGKMLDDYSDDGTEHLIDDNKTYLPSDSEDGTITSSEVKEELIIYDYLTEDANSVIDINTDKDFKIELADNALKASNEDFIPKEDEQIAEDNLVDGSSLIAETNNQAKETGALIANQDYTPQKDMTVNGDLIDSSRGIVFAHDLTDTSITNTEELTTGSIPIGETIQEDQAVIQTKTDNNEFIPLTNGEVSKGDCKACEDLAKSDMNTLTTLTKDPSVVPETLEIITTNSVVDDSIFYDVKEDKVEELPEAIPNATGNENDVVDQTNFLEVSVPDNENDPLIRFAQRYINENKESYLNTQKFLDDYITNDNSLDYHNLMNSMDNTYEKDNFLN